ncbi:MAG: sugar transferase [Verrucomicrobiales bacterium]|nr:sugar transferase [Verrucomicrobiales bacterium]
MEVTSIPVSITGQKSQDALGPRRQSLAGPLSTVAFIGDLLSIIAGLCFAFWLRFQSGWIRFGVELPSPPALTDYLGLFAVGTTFLSGLLVYTGVYHHRHLLRFRRTALLIVRSSMTWLALYLGVSLALKFDPPISRIYAASSAVACALTLIGWRAVFHGLLQNEAIASRVRTRVLFVGWNDESSRLSESIAGDPSHPYEVVGFVPSLRDHLDHQPPEGVSRLGDYAGLGQLLQAGIADMVVVADLDPSTDEMVALANVCERHFVQFKVIPSYFQILVSGLELETISGVPVLGVSRLPLDRSSRRLMKRMVDIIGSVVGLLISVPIITYCGWRIRREDPGPIFFGQERIGRDGRPFTMWKLRSMHLGSEATDHLNQSTLRNDSRVLPIGRAMRRWNLDEIPQFWNVLKGEMSLVGPRPERTFHSLRLSENIPHYNARYATKPGITGWAQIHGLRGDTDLAKRVNYDIYYLENWSLLMDFQILVLTFFRRENAY